MMVDLDPVMVVVIPVVAVFVVAWRLDYLLLSEHRSPI